MKDVLANATPERSGSGKAGIVAQNEKERIAARLLLADLPLKVFLEEPIIPYEEDAVTRLIIDTREEEPLSSVAHLTVGGFREWLLAYETDGEKIRMVSPGLAPEIVAVVSKIMSNQDLILVFSKIRIITIFRNTLVLEGYVSTPVSVRGGTSVNERSNQARSLSKTTTIAVQWDRIVGIMRTL